MKFPKNVSMGMSVRESTVCRNMMLAFDDDNDEIKTNLLMRILLRMRMKKPDDEVNNDTVNVTFCNQSHVATNYYECHLSDEYKTRIKNQAVNHKSEAHPFHCCECHTLFVSKTQCRKHIQQMHITPRQIQN